MKDLAAVAPLLLVAGVFVGVCIVALRATDWRRLDDRRPVARTEPKADGSPTADDAAGPATAGDAADPDGPGPEPEHDGVADASTRGTDPAAARTQARDAAVAPAEARDPDVAADEPGVRPGDEPVDPDAAAPRGRHRSGPGT